MIASSTGEDNLYMKTGKIIYKLVQKVFFFAIINSRKQYKIFFFVREQICRLQLLEPPP